MIAQFLMVAMVVTNLLDQIPLTIGTRRAVQLLFGDVGLSGVAYLFDSHVDCFRV